ncbi:MAG: iron donor protein CyaY, partial [Pseudohongiellaceae bacterium]
DALEEAIEDSGADLDYESVNDILTLTFADGSAVIVTKQTVTRQLWLAARSGGFHFDYDTASAQWRRTGDGQPFTGVLRQVCLEQGAVELELQ